MLCLALLYSPLPAENLAVDEEPHKKRNFNLLTDKHVILITHLTAEYRAEILSLLEKSLEIMIEMFQTEVGSLFGSDTKVSENLALTFHLIEAFGKKGHSVKDPLQRHSLQIPPAFCSD